MTERISGACAVSLPAESKMCLFVPRQKMEVKMFPKRHDLKCKNMKQKFVICDNWKMQQNSIKFGPKCSPVMIKLTPAVFKLCPGVQWRRLELLVAGI